ncbi:MAG: glycerol-3-phosphate dehydrogenase [Candidatus Latescibacterota bacterium]|nr:MAG: glycerol-3-phosphate dehydrogenase [Candidatus Latescibacterota bacterium]RKY73419.1 MAG: glycerol-3-phosphate dehydrogenase [Candidatus Latescibacterota bacterium]
MRIAVIGAGGWGTALSVLLAGRGHQIFLWQREKDLAQEARRTRENRVFLPGVRIPEGVEISWKISEVVPEADMWVFAVPSQYVRQVARAVGEVDGGEGKLVVSVAKGIEEGSLKRMSEVLLEELPGLSSGRLAVLSGPSHAEEVGRGMPTSVVTASASVDTARTVQEAFFSPNFRVYTSDDVVGVELGGALKNVIAIAVGICDGLELGDNAKGALIARGLAEITRLGVAMGARPETFAGLSGAGDLITTCISRHSRNRYVGEQVGRGRSLEEVLDEMVMVAEGVRTAEAARKLALRYGVEMPITEKVHQVLFEGYDPRRALEDLMLRQPKPEVWGWA